MPNEDGLYPSAVTAIKLDRSRSKDFDEEERRGRDAMEEDWLRERDLQMRKSVRKQEDHVNTEVSSGDMGAQSLDSDLL